GHSMDSSDDRPNIALINYGDQDGEGDETTASPQFMQEFKTCLEKQFRWIGADIAIEMNTPYDYGHSIRHVKDAFPDLTSLQIELRKDLYLNEKTQEVLPGRAREIKCKVQKAVFDVLKNL
ncbi:MAG: N-formylglutamate amidohydrolase, partial [Proteobacteria bacterium]|nr:N-formylglutamate amidohydrolase [Pseudomonadota bacterium]